MFSRGSNTEKLKLKILGPLRRKQSFELYLNPFYCSKGESDQYTVDHKKTTIEEPNFSKITYNILLFLRYQCSPLYDVEYQSPILNDAHLPNNFNESTQKLPLIA